MFLIKRVLTLLFLCSFMLISAQVAKKNLVTKRVDTAPKIDGELNDDAWINADVATDFIMFRPSSGLAIPKGQETEVRVVYDDEAIYFGAYLYDNKPDDILKQFSTRDNFGTADWFAVAINPNDDSQNDTAFFVQISGNQLDAKINLEDEDFSWSGVWSSSVKIVDDGWIVEIKIPYSALRFSNANVQTWGINFHRVFEKSQDHYTWNFIDRTKGEIPQYSGTLSGIENIKPPTRLSFTPYASAAVDSKDGESTFNTSIGLDLKYGISESFTLDMTLIPDFGQTAFDNIVLNLGPFEQIYQERRPFFTEGLDLFSKGDMFYTRRVGNAPVNMLGDDHLNENEEIVDNPDKVVMLNAIKVSGRTKKGLGIGVFNAITEETFGKIKDTITGETRSQVTEPLANYNVIVLDQQFNKNSSVTLVNTNVLREGSARSANATGFLYNINTKSNKYFIDGAAKLSSIQEDGETTHGNYFNASIGKDAGNWQYSVEYEMADENYDINDLGFNRRNNYQDLEADVSYRIFEPNKTFRRYRLNFSSEINYRKSDGAYTGNEISLRFNATTLNNFSFGSMLSSNIGDQYDYYEPRVDDRYYTESPRMRGFIYVETNPGKKLSVESFIYLSSHLMQNQSYLKYEIEPEYRITDKFTLNYSFNHGKGTNEKGYVDELDDGTIIFGNRNTQEITNSLSGQFNFDIKSAVVLAFRHYWSPIVYDSQFYELNEDGTLSPHFYSENEDINYNIWNLDLSYTWEFAPGSHIIALYRNNIFNEDDLSKLLFTENLENLFKEPIQHNLSIKMIYYIDYNNAKNWFKKG